MRTVCRSLGEEYELSEHLKNFTYLAKLARQKFIDEVFINKSRPPLFRPIPITKKEAETQESEENMSKSRDFAEKRSELLSILTDIKYLFSSGNRVDNHNYYV